MEKLRFAPLIRVSTEQQQEDRKASLENQRKQIIQWVEQMGGTIPDECWHYFGQEHATPGYERKMLDRLLKDAAKDIFDAVIVYDQTRWSRDNVKADTGLDILKSNKIKFFIGTSPMDLYDPTVRLFLTMGSAIGQWQARLQSKKSIESRILNAKKGIPTAGKLPYGRTFHNGVWGVDPEKKQRMVWAADQYLNHGTGLLEIARTIDMNAQNLWRTLREKCGDQFVITFDHPEFDIHEVVTISVPEILPRETIEAIHRKLEGNKTYSHGQIFRKYLLGRMIFCADCGKALVGDRHQSGRYSIYKHQKHQDVNPDCPNYRRWTIKADAIEEAVFLQIFSMYGDVDSMEKAMMKAIPDVEGIEALRQVKGSFEKELQGIIKQKDNVIVKISKELITDDEAGKILAGLREREAQLKSEIAKINPQIENVPTKKQISSFARRIREVITKAHFTSHAALRKMTFDQKRALLQRVFDGKDVHGRRLGVYVRKNGSNVEYQIRGHFGQAITGQLPMTDYERENLVTDYNDSESSFSIGKFSSC